MKIFSSITFLLFVVTKSFAVDTITLGTLSNTNFCATNSISVPFTSTLPSGTQFTVRLKKGAVILNSNTGNTSPLNLYMDDSKIVFGTDYTIDVISGSTKSLNSSLLTIGNIGVAFLSDGENQQVYYSTDYICTGKSKTYFATVRDYYRNNITENVTYQWKKDGIDIPNAIQNNYTATQAGNYTFTATQGGCVLNSNSVNMVFSPNFNSILKIEGDNYACAGTEKRIQATYISTSSTYQWFKDGVQISGATNRVHPATISGNYSVNVYDGACVGSFGPKQITFSNGLHAPIISSNTDTTICGGSGVQLVAHSVFEFPNQYQYQWQRNGIDIAPEQYYSSTSPNYYARQSGNYSVIYKQGDCVTSSKIKQIVSSNLAQKPVITIQNGFDICQGSIKINQVNEANLLNGFSHNLAGNYYGGLPGKWLKGGIEIPNYFNDSYTATQAGTYKLQVGYGNCAVESNEIILNFSNPISPKIVAASNKTNLCGSNDYTFLIVDFQNISNTTFTYIWKKDGIAIPNQTGSGLFVTTPGTYSLILNNGTCSGESNAVTITNNNSFSIKSNSNDLLCTNQLVKLTPFDGVGNLSTPLIWKINNVVIAGETSNSIYVNQPGTYTATVNQSGCVATSTPFILNTNEVPNAPNVSPVSINNGEPATLTATGCSGTVKWYDLPTGGSLVGTGSSFTSPALISNTNYFADCSNANCTSIVRKKVLVTVIGGVGPIQISTLSSYNYCVGNTILVPFTTSLPIGTNYTVKLFKAGQLISSSTNTTSPISLYISTQILYGTDYSVQIVSGENSSLESPAITIGNINYGNITDINKNSINYANLCPGKEKVIYASIYSFNNNLIESNISYQWKKDGVNIVGATENFYIVNSSGVYTFTATQGCSINSSSMLLEMTNYIQGDYFSGGSKLNCIGTNRVLTAFYYSNTATYQWQKDNVDIPNAINRSFSASESGIYNLKVFDGTCSANYNSNNRLTFGTGIIAKITANLGDTTLCGGNSVVLFASNDAPNGAPYTFKWQKDGVDLPNSNFSNIYVYQPGAYTVEYQQGNCISKSRTLEVIASNTRQKPKITAGRMTDICAGSIQINQDIYSGINNATYFGLFGLWYKNNVLISNGTNNSYTATQSGNYKMVYGTGNCAVESNTVAINIGGTSITPKIYNSNSKIDLNLCGYNDFIILSSESTPNTNLNNASYQWRKNGQNLQGQTSSSLFVTAPGEYSLFLVNDVCAGLSNTITITNNNQINISVSDNDTYCTNRAVLFETDTRAGFKTAIWKRNDVVIPNETSNFIYATLPGNYSVTVDEYGCQASSAPILFNAGVPAEIFTIKSGNWTDPLCWICNQIPSGTTGVKISNGHIINVPTGAHDVKNVKLEGTVNFETGGEIKVNGGN